MQENTHSPVYAYVGLVVSSHGLLKRCNTIELNSVSCREGASLSMQLRIPTLDIKPSEFKFPARIWLVATLEITLVKSWAESIQGLAYYDHMWAIPKPVQLSANWHVHWAAWTLEYIAKSRYGPRQDAHLQVHTRWFLSIWYSCNCDHCTSSLVVSAAAGFIMMNEWSSK